MVSWLHLSDFHCGKDDYGTRKLFKCIIGEVSKKISSQKLDFIFITGDVANKGLASEYELFFTEFYTPIQDLVSPYGCQIVITPGNHDAKRTKIPFDVSALIQPSNRFFETTNTGLDNRSDLIDRFQEFKSLLLSSELGIFEENGFQLYKRNIGGVSAGIVAINTSWIAQGSEDEGRLIVGKDFIEKALENISDCDCKIFLGHHPISWISEVERHAIESLFARNNVIYLHGHLHIGKAKEVHIRRSKYTAIQTGAAFQCREGDKWKNGLLWGEYDHFDSSVSLQYFTWNYNEQIWTLDSSAFSEEFRVSDKWKFPTKSHIQTEERVKAPDGWDYFESLRGKTPEALDHEKYIEFFDGAQPEWQIATSHIIPRREDVNKLVKKLESSNKQSEAVSIFSVLAPAGEGKSTVLMQSAFDFCSKAQDFAILRRTNSSIPLDTAVLQKFLASKQRVVIVIDDCDNAMDGIFSIASYLNKKRNAKYLILTATRFIDWISGKFDSIHWGSLVPEKIEINGLTYSECVNIVKCWDGFGDEGLRQLASITEQERVNAFAAKSKHSENEVSESLLGAVLAVRFGESLKDHVFEQMHKVKRLQIKRVDLTDAIYKIAAMHVHDFSFLSQEVLAQSLGIASDELFKKVIHPLGKEAVAACSGTRIYARHKSIASAIIEYAKSIDGVDAFGLVLNLCRTAAVARSQGHYISQIDSWRYALPKHYADIGELERAQAISNMLTEIEPTNALLLVNLSSICRKIGDPELARERLYYGAKVNPEERSIYNELSVVEFETNRHYDSLLLQVYAASIECSPQPPTLESQRRTIQSLTTRLNFIFENYGDSEAGELSQSLRSHAKFNAQSSHINPIDRYIPKILSHASERAKELAMRKGRLTLAINFNNPFIFERLKMDA